MLRIVLLEVEDVLDLGTTEGIDGLRVITHHTDVLMDLAELLQDEILRVIGVLILVDHDIVKASGDGHEGLLAVTKQYVHIQKDIIEIHHSRKFALMGIKLINVHYARLLGGSIVLLRRRIAAISARSHQVVLRHGYARKHILRLIDLFVKLEFLYACLDGADRVACVIDCECLRISENLREFAKEPDEDRVECTHIKPPRTLLAHHEGDSLLHLRSGLLRKCQSQNPCRIALLLCENVCNPACKHPGLSRSRTRYYQHRSVNTADSGNLLAVQPFQDSVSLVSHTIYIITITRTQNYIKHCNQKRAFYFVNR